MSGHVNHSSVYHGTQSVTCVIFVIAVFILMMVMVNCFAEELLWWHNDGRCYVLFIHVPKASDCYRAIWWLLHRPFVGVLLHLVQSWGTCTKLSESYLINRRGIWIAAHVCDQLRSTVVISHCYKPSGETAASWFILSSFCAAVASQARIQASFYAMAYYRYRVIFFTASFC